MTDNQQAKSKDCNSILRVVNSCKKQMWKTFPDSAASAPSVILSHQPNVYQQRKNLFKNRLIQQSPDGHQTR